MSLEAVCSRHTVTVLNQTEAQGSQMGRRTTWAAATPPVTLTCTVVPGVHGGSRTIADLLRQKGAVMPHTLYFTADPGLDERYRLLWGATTLRIISLPRDAHGQARLWILYADAHTDDNATTAIR